MVLSVEEVRPVSKRAALPEQSSREADSPPVRNCSLDAQRVAEQPALDKRVSVLDAAEPETAKPVAA